MEILKFNGFGSINESKIDNVVLNDSINQFLKDLKTYVWDNVSRYDNDLSIKGSEYEFYISYDVVSEDEFVSLVERFINRTMTKYNISKIGRIDRGLYLYFTFDNETYSIPLILTMNSGNRVKYGVWLNMDVCKKI